MTVDPSLSKLLALEATTVVDPPTYQSTSVLHQVLAADPIIARYSWPKDLPLGTSRGYLVSGILLTDLDPAGRLLVASAASRLEVADARTGAVLWAYPDSDLGAAIGQAYFSADGEQVIAGLAWDQPDVAPPAGTLGAFIWDAHTGELQKRIDLGPCGGSVNAVSQRALLVRTPSRSPDGPGCRWPPTAAGSQLAAVLVVNPVTGASRVLADTAIVSYGGTLSGDGRYAGFDLFEAGTFTSVVVEIATGKRVFQLKVHR